MQFYVFTVVIRGKVRTISAPADGLSTPMKVAIGVGVGATAAAATVVAVVGSGA